MNKLFLLVFVVFIWSCEKITPKKKSGALARVGSSYLSHNELDNLGLENATKEDSLKIIIAYINNWVHREAYLQYAQKQMTDSQLAEIKQKVDDYQQSLFTHLYESQIVANQLDTVVTQQEIEDYYNTHTQDLTINEPIVRYILIKKDKRFENKRTVERYIDEYIDSGNDAELLEYCTYNTIGYQLDDRKWFSQKSLLETFGPMFSKTEIDWKTSKLQEIHYQDYDYLCKILEFKADGTYPLSYVEDKIKKNILRVRERELIKKLRFQIIERAKQNNEIEIYESE